MAGPSALFTEANKSSTHNTNSKPYLPPTFLRVRAFSNLDSQSTQETEPTPTPNPQRTLKDATLPPSLQHRRGSFTALSSPSELPLLPQVTPDTPTTSSGSEYGDTDDEDIQGVLDEYNVEGVTKEDLKLWMQSAPEDQKLERVHDMKLDSTNQLEARYSIEGISREDLELWHELAPADQKLEVGSDTEMEMDEVDPEPRSRTPDLRSLQKAAPTEARRTSTSSIEQLKAMHVNHFIRRHPFLQTSLVSHTTSERRGFERDIYDYARGLGLSTSAAHKEVLKGRAFCGEEDYNSDDTALGDEVDDSAVTMRRLSTPAVSRLEHLQSDQMTDVLAIAKAPRERKRRKKQSTVDPPANTKAEDVVMEAEVSAAQRETIQVPQGRSKSSEDTSSKFFPKECELGKKRKRETADRANVQAKKKPKKETRKQKSNKVDDQAPASGQVDQAVSSADSISNVESRSKDRDILVNTHATADDDVEEMKDADTMNNKSEVTANGKNREKRKKRKGKSKGPEAPTMAESTNAAESLGNVVATDEGSDYDAPATAKDSTSHAINESLQEQESLASVKPAVPSDEGGSNLTVDLVAIRAARKLRKQERRRAGEKTAKGAREKEDAAAVVLPVAKINEPDKIQTDFDDHPINQITGLLAPSVNELMGIPRPNDERGRGRAEHTAAHGPNDPKSTTEARRNLLMTAERDPIEHGITVNTNHEQHLTRTKKSEDLVAQLDALKDFSNKKQVELFDQGHFSHADKQTKDDLKEIKNGLQLDKDADENQADVEHPKKKRRRKRKSGAEEDHADNEDGSENVKTEKVEPVKTDVDLTPRDPGFQSPMIQ